MNLRGKVINKYLKDTTEKFKKRQNATRLYIGYLHTERMDALIITAYILANRSKIEVVAKEGYRLLKTPEQIVENFYTREENGFFEACCLDMGFGVTAKDIDKGCKLDYSLYNDYLDNALLEEVQRVFSKIDSHTLTLF